MKLEDIDESLKKLSAAVKGLEMMCTNILQDVSQIRSLLEEPLDGPTPRRHSFSQIGTNSPTNMSPPHAALGEPSKPGSPEDALRSTDEEDTSHSG